MQVIDRNSREGSVHEPCCASCVSSTSSHLDVMKAGLAAEEADEDAEDKMADLDACARTGFDDTNANTYSDPLRIHSTS